MLVRIPIITFFIDLSKHLRFNLPVQYYDVYLSFVAVSRDSREETCLFCVVPAIKILLQIICDLCLCHH